MLNFTLAAGQIHPFTITPTIDANPDVTAQIGPISCSDEILTQGGLDLTQAVPGSVLSFTPSFGVSYSDGTAQNLSLPCQITVAPAVVTSPAAPSAPPLPSDPPVAPAVPPARVEHVYGANISIS